MPTSGVIMFHGESVTDGVICEEGTPEQIFTAPRRQETQAFLARFRAG